jgi:hypothetical protein
VSTERPGIRAASQRRASPPTAPLAVTRAGRLLVGDFDIMLRLITRAGATFGVVLALSACSNPYDPGQRALGGGAIGAGAGAAIGGLAGGGHGAAIGALAGGALGALTGAVTTPYPPPTYHSQPAY